MLAAGDKKLGLVTYLAHVDNGVGLMSLSLSFEWIEVACSCSDGWWCVLQEEVEVEVEVCLMCWWKKRNLGINS